MAVAEPSTPYEKGFQELQALSQWFEEHKETLNEADTRFKLVDRLFFNCLGWASDDVTMEDAFDGEYTDYVFSAPRQILIVEAKREGQYFEVPAGKENLFYSIPSLLRNNKALKAAVEQAAGYCQKRGVPFGVVCNGHQLVAFVAGRTDAVAPLEGEALVFHSLDHIGREFLQLWNLLSRPGIESRNLSIRLLGEPIPQLPPKLSSTIDGYPGFKNRNPFQSELQILSEAVIEDLARTSGSEAEFLKQCYCKNETLSQYSVLSKSILGSRYAGLSAEDTPGPYTIPVSEGQKLATEVMGNMSRRPLLILGDVGVGKTTFVRNLIQVEAPELLKDALVFYIDLGSKAVLTLDLRQFILNDITDQLRETYHREIDEDSFIREVYAEQLKRFQRGVYSGLRQTNPSLFAEKEIDELVRYTRDREPHIRHSLFRISDVEQRQVVIFLDNSDQRTEETQQLVFLIAQEMAANWPATVFVSLRPETFYRSLKVGALTAYHPKAFTISPPATEQVIKKRLQFALKIISGEVPLHSSLVKLDNLKSLILAFLFSLEASKQLPEMIESVSAGNIRRALEIVRNFFGSGHVNTEKICRIYEQTNRYHIPLHEIVRAVIFGDAVYYAPQQSPIVNLFDLSSLDVKEHFSLPLLIGMLQALETSHSDSGFVSSPLIYEQMQKLGFLPEQIDLALIRGIRSGLIEPSTRRIPEPGQMMPKSFRPTSLGVYHVTRLPLMFTYLDAMIEDTPILDSSARRHILLTQTIEDRLKRCGYFVDYLDGAWETFSDRGAAFAFDWPRYSTAIRDEITKIRERVQKGPAPAY